MGSNVGTNMVALIVGSVLLYQPIPPAVKEARPVYKGLKLRHSAVPLLLISGANVLFGQSDTLIVGALKGAAAVGAYSVAHKGADFISFALNVQNAAFLSTAAGLYAAGDLKRSQRLVTRLGRLTFLAVIPLGAFLVFLGLVPLGLWRPIQPCPDGAGDIEFQPVIQCCVWGCGDAADCDRV
jgi:O-antigen/teichoic acid export membrane protein